MVLEHLAAILLFSGPLFWVGLWMAVDPAGIAMIPERLVRMSKSVVQKLGGLPSGEIVEPRFAISRRTKTALRLAGVMLALFSIAA